MRLEVIESRGEWIVTNDGEEVGRFGDDNDALNHAASLLRRAPDSGEAVSLRVRYRAQD